MSARSPLARLDPRRPPLRWLLRAPIALYRAHLGWLLGRRFAQVTVRGRRSGLPRHVVLEVIGGDPAAGELHIVSAWGSRAEWFRNLLADPRVELRVGRHSFSGEIRVLDAAGATAVLRAYARNHAWVYRWVIGPLLLGRVPTSRDEELASLAAVLPVLLFRAEPPREPPDHE